MLRNCSWNDFCAAVIDRLQRDQHNYIVRQFLHIRQQGTVAEYIEHFDDPVHQLHAHDPKLDSILLTNIFVDGLRHDIRAVVMIHKPIDLDAASSLALLQEELTSDGVKRDFKRNEVFPAFKSPVKQASSSQVQQAFVKDLVYSSPEEKKHVESLRATTMEEKLAAIKAFRRAKGPCYKCGVRWAPSHKCAPTVALHVVEELWQVLQDKESSSSSSALADDYDSADDLMCVSTHASNGTETPRTIRMVGNLHGHKPLILVDSGSSSTFVSEQLAASIPRWTPLATPVSVRIANGSVLLYTHEIKQCDLFIQGHHFQLDLKIIPLQCYDVVIGMD